MRKEYFVIVAGLFFLLVAFFIFSLSQKAVQGKDEKAIALSASTYVSQHISRLSPVKEQLGGTFYVTEVVAKDGNGTVMYEDGHNAYVADYEYAFLDGGMVISNFKIRE